MKSFFRTLRHQPEHRPPSDDSASPMGQEAISGFVVRAKVAFKPTDANMVLVQPGDMVQVLEDDSSGWTYVRNLSLTPSCNGGWVPSWVVQLSEDSCTSLEESSLDIPEDLGEEDSGLTSLDAREPTATTAQASEVVGRRNSVERTRSQGTFGTPREEHESAQFQPDDVVGTPGGEKDAAFSSSGGKGAAGGKTDDAAPSVKNAMSPTRREEAKMLLRRLPSSRAAGAGRFWVRRSRSLPETYDGATASSRRVHGAAQQSGKLWRHSASDSLEARVDAVARAEVVVAKARWRGRRSRSSDTALSRGGDAAIEVFDGPVLSADRGEVKPVMVFAAPKGDVEPNTSMESCSGPPAPAKVVRDLEFAFDAVGDSRTSASASAVSSAWLLMAEGLNTQASIDACTPIGTVSSSCLSSVLTSWHAAMSSGHAASLQSQQEHSPANVPSVRAEGVSEAIVSGEVTLTCSTSMDMGADAEVGEAEAPALAPPIGDELGDSARCGFGGRSAGRGGNVANIGELRSPLATPNVAESGSFVGPADGVGHHHSDAVPELGSSWRALPSSAEAPQGAQAEIEQLRRTVETLKCRLRERDMQKQKVSAELLEARRLIWEHKTKAEQARRALCEVVAETEGSSIAFEELRAQTSSLAQDICDGRIGLCEGVARRGRRSRTGCARRSLALRAFVQEQQGQLHQACAPLAESRQYAGGVWRVDEERLDIVRRLEQGAAARAMLTAARRHPSGEVFLGACDPDRVGHAGMTVPAVWPGLSLHQQPSVGAITGDNASRGQCARSDPRSASGGSDTNSEAPTVLFSDVSETCHVGGGSAPNIVDSPVLGAILPSAGGGLWGSSRLGLSPPSTLGCITEGTDEVAELSSASSPGQQSDAATPTDSTEFFSPSELVTLGLQAASVVDHEDACDMGWQAPASQDSSSIDHSAARRSARQRVIAEGLLAPVLRLSGDRLWECMTALRSWSASSSFSGAERSQGEEDNGEPASKIEASELTDSRETTSNVCASELTEPGDCDSDRRPTCELDQEQEFPASVTATASNSTPLCSPDESCSPFPVPDGGHEREHESSASLTGVASESMPFSSDTDSVIVVPTTAQWDCALPNSDAAVRRLQCCARVFVAQTLLLRQRRQAELQPKPWEQDPRREQDPLQEQRCLREHPQPQPQSQRQRLGQEQHQPQPKQRDQDLQQQQELRQEQRPRPQAQLQQAQPQPQLQLHREHHVHQRSQQNVQQQRLPQPQPQGNATAKACDLGSGSYGGERRAASSVPRLRVEVMKNRREADQKVPGAVAVASFDEAKTVPQWLAEQRWSTSSPPCGQRPSTGATLRPRSTSALAKAHRQSLGNVKDSRDEHDGDGPKRRPPRQHGPRLGLSPAAGAAAGARKQRPSPRPSGGDGRGQAGQGGLATDAAVSPTCVDALATRHSTPPPLHSPGARLFAAAGNSAEKMLAIKAVASSYAWPSMSDAAFGLRTPPSGRHAKKDMATDGFECTRAAITDCWLLGGPHRSHGRPSAAGGGLTKTRPIAATLQGIDPGSRALQLQRMAHA